MPNPFRGSADNRVVGLGACGQDTLALVAAYPDPDQKIRTQRLLVQGGGNCGNVLTAVARLGVHAAIVSMVGSDAPGDAVEAELRRDGVATELLLRSREGATPSTFIIVDAAGGTRTCIHTPGRDLEASDMTDTVLERALCNTGLVYLDGRHASAAAVLAQAARARGIAILVDAEKPREGLDGLLAQADYVTTSATFPQAWTQQNSLGEALRCMLSRLPRARWLLTTQGACGAVAVGREHEGEGPEPAGELQAVLGQLWSRVDDETDCPGDTCSTPPACITADGTEIRLQGYATAPAAVHGEIVHVTVTRAARIDGPVVDTTGAGDAYVGALLVGISGGSGLEATVRCGMAVAAAKCTALGARTGLPQASQLDWGVFGA